MFRQQGTRTHTHTPQIEGGGFVFVTSTQAVFSCFVTSYVIVRLTLRFAAENLQILASLPQKRKQQGLAISSFVPVALPGNQRARTVLTYWYESR